MAMRAIILLSFKSSVRRIISSRSVCLPFHFIYFNLLNATLKRSYSREVKVLIRYHINHITELEFLLALEVAVRTQVRTHHAMQPKRIV
jgi:hypothetical protein